MRRRGAPGGVRLTNEPGPRISLPKHLSDLVRQGDEARRLASHVSGPFTANPFGYAAPPNAERLAELLTWAAREGIPVIPRGGGTGMPGGNLGPHLVVEIGPAFRGIAWVDEGRTRLRAGAGSLAVDVERVARAAGRTLPFLPSSLDRCTVGGMVANNAAGVRTFRHGSTAAFTDRVEGFFAGGTPFRVGGGADDRFRPLHAELVERLGPFPPWPAVRKNSSGYALDRFLPSGDPVALLVGSEGTLATVTAAEFRTIPAPAERALVVVALASARELTDLALAAPDLPVDTCEFLGRSFLRVAGLANDPRVGGLAGNAYALALLEVTGGGDELDARMERVVAALGGGGADGRHAEPTLSPRAPLLATRDPDEVAALWALRRAASPTIAREAGRGRISTQFIEDSVVPVPRLADYLDGLDRILERTRFEAVVFGHAGDGNVHVNPLVDTGAGDWRDRVRDALEEVVELVAALGGTLTGEHGDGRLRAPFLPRIWPSATVDAFRRVKEELDPDGLLNPGVILPLPGQDPLEFLRPRGPQGEGTEPGLPPGALPPDLAGP